VLAWAGLPAFGQDHPIAFIGARIIPVVGREVERGALVVSGGHIVSVGDEIAAAVPPDAELIDVSGYWIMPGLIDTHSHIGGVGGADGSNPIQPEVRVWESINVRAPGFRRAVAGGITTVNLMPGSGHLCSGQTIYAKLRAGRTIEDLSFSMGDGSLAGGLKMANGTNSHGAPPFPETRGKSAALVRERFVKAREYLDKIARAGDDAEKRPARDLGLEVLGEVLEGKRIVHHHTHRQDDIMTVLRLANEFHFRVVLHHVSEASLVVTEIAASGVPCSVIIVDSPGGKLEAANLQMETAANLEKAGVKVALHTDDWINDSRLFLRCAGLAVRAGMTRDGAFRAVTLAGAEMLDLQDRVGSLEPGKDADFILLTGNPLSTYTHVQQTWVEGVKVFDRENPEDLLSAQGGYGAGEDVHPYMCCEEAR
jgi:imidazolonepropionase-like amidohydrolase